MSADSCTAVGKLGAEQSNTSIIIGEAFVLKLYRKMEQGLNPDVEMSLFLTEKEQVYLNCQGFRYNAVS